MLKLLHNCTHLTYSKVMLKILQARLQHTWTVNFHMFKLVLFIYLFIYFTFLDFILFLNFT